MDTDRMKWLDAQVAAYCAVQEHYETYAKPFKWKYTRQDLLNLLAKISHEERPLLLAAA